MKIELNSLALKSGDRVLQRPKVISVRDFAFRKVLGLLDELDKNLNNIEQNLIEEGLISKEGVRSQEDVIKEVTPC